MVDLGGKNALVTGASRGIGRAVAVKLAVCGANVAVNYRTRESEAESVCRHVTSLGRMAIPVQADVSSSSAVAQMVETVEEGLGSIDILVNNAGIAKRQDIEAVTESDWDEVLTTNLKSVFLVTQAVLPQMRRRRWGRIINVSSGAIQTGGGVGIHYTASKAGIEGLTRAYASRLVKEGITVNAVAPTLIDTDMTSDREDSRRRIPLGRLGQPDEVADAVVFLAQNEYMTGQTLHLNGGLFFH